MNILFLAIPLAIALGSFFLFSFFWAVEKGQFDDLETPAHRILFEDNKIDEPNPIQQEKT